MPRSVGDRYACEKCGAALVYEKACPCSATMSHSEICCGQQMQAVGGTAAKGPAQPAAGASATDAQSRLIEGLNTDLRGEFQAVIMYRLYASMVQGPYRQELRNFFAAEIPEELTHAQLLADKIAALGGTPAAVPAPVTVVSDAKQMIAQALTAEVETIDRYITRRRQAEEAQEFGLAAELDGVIADETRHRDELRQMLARWP